MSTAQLEARRKQLAAEKADLDRLVRQAVATKNYQNIDALEARVAAFEEAKADLELADLRAKSFENFKARTGFDPDAARTQASGPMPAAKGVLHKGRDAYPLAFSTEALEMAHKAAASRQTVSTKAFSTVDGLLPAQLDQNVLGKVHEGRLLDHLPVQAISAPSYEILVHTSSTGAAGPTAEGAVKPEITLNVSPQTVTAVKLAANFAISYESIQDFVNFRSYAETEIIRQVIDVENAQLIAGSGTGGNMTGFLNTSGILTHDASTDTAGGATYLDSIEKSIAQLRVGAALAVPDLFVVHPLTWSAIRRLKDSTGRYLFISANSDPSNAEANKVFDVDVLVTTQISAGTGLMLDTNKVGRVFIREGITLHQGTSADDFVRNLTRTVVEERLVLGVERPSAALAISNLPTA